MSDSSYLDFLRSVPALQKDRLVELVHRFAGHRLLVIGDLMLDEYLWGTVHRISPEAPVPVVEVEHYSYGLGGAGNVVHNLVRLGAQVFVAGVIGEDSSGSRLLESLEKVGADTRAVIKDPSRPTTTKTRVVAHNQQVVRIDREKRDKIAPEILQELLRRVLPLLPQVEVVLCSDYNKGVLLPPLVDPIRKEALRMGCLLTANPKPPNLAGFSHFHFLTMNQTEAQRASGVEILDEASLVKTGEKILQEIHCHSLAVTQGPRGLTLFLPPKKTGETPEVLHIPTLPSEVFDVTGAGDTVISVASLALSAGATPIEASALGNIGGSLKVRKIGAVPVPAEEILAVLKGDLV